MVQQAFRVDKVSTSNIEFKSNSFISSIASDASLASNVHLVLPTSVGSSGQVLATDGSGNLSFVSQGVGGPADLVQDNVNSLTSTVDSFGVYANNTFGAGGSNVSVANVTSQEFSIDGSTNTFTLVNTTDNVNKLLVSYGGIAQKPSEYTVSNTSLTLSNNRPLVSGTTVEVRYLDFEFSGSVGSGSGGGGVISGTSYSSTLYNNTSAGITTFNDVSTPALPTYTVGKIGVYVNGVKLSNNAFSASTGDSVVLDNATLLGDDVEIVNFGMSSASLNDLTDVDITTNTPSNGQALVYVNANSKWEPGTVASSYGNSDVDLHLNQSTASTDQVLSWSGSDYAWVDQSAGGSSGSSTPALTEYEFIATANQTSFTATYTPGSIQLFLNGVKLANTEFTATTGSSIVLGANTAPGDIVSISKIGGSSNLTVSNAAASSTGSISYDNGSEVLTYTPPDLSGYQSTLVSNTNIKTINGNSILGSGNITISSGGGIAGTLGSLTKSFANNESSTITLSSNVNPVPNVSVFKEVPVPGVSSKGQWDVNANATNYDFYDEKPISYASTTLTPSATGDGTFTNSTAIVTGYNFTNFTYDSVTAATGISGNNEAIRFNNNGTKMYILSDGGPDGIYQFSLSTAYDITTASYDSVSFSVTQDSSPRDFQFNSDGSKMFILGSTNRQIYRYSLSTAYDLSTTSYDSVSLSIAYSTSMLHFHFNGDGTKIYVGSSATWTIYERQLPGAYDISSESAVSTFGYNADLPSGSTEAYAYSGIFNDNGKKMYLLIGRMPDTSEAVIEYDLSTAYDLSTISRTSIQTLNPSNAGNDPRGMTWNSDGTKLIILTEPDDMFRFTSSTSSAFNAADVGKKVVGNSGSAIITSTAGAYTSVTAFADTSAISSWQLFGAEGKADGSGIVFTQAGAPGGIPTSTLTDQSGPHTIHTGFFNQGFWWSNDGQYYYQLSQGNSTIVKVKCTTPWDLSTQTDEQTVSTTGTSHGITVSEDGLNIYYGGYDARIRRKPLSTAHDLSTAGSETSILCTDLNVAASYPWDFDISSDGTKLFFLSHIGGSHDGIGTLNLSTPYAIHTGVTLGTVLTNFDGGGHSQTFFSFNSDGSRLFVSNNTTSIYYWNLSSAYTLPSSATSDGSISFSGSNGQRSMVFDQYLFYTSFHDDRGGALGVEHEKQNRWTLSTSIDASSTTPAYSQYFPALTNSSTGQINSSSWQDINSMTADETKNDGEVFYAVSTDNRSSWGVAKGSDGVRKIAKNNSGTWQYNNHAGVTVGYDFSNPTAGATSTFTAPDWHVFAFNTTGTKFISLASLKLKSYNLSTAWDISTISSTVDAEATVADLYGTTISADGTKLIGYHSGVGYVFEYTMSTPFDVTTLTSNGNTGTLGGVSTSGAFNWFIKPGTYDTVYALINRHLYKYTFTGGSLISGTVTRDPNFIDLDPSNQKNYINSGQLQFKPDGTEFYIGQGTDSIIERWVLSTPWDITTATKSSDTVPFTAAGNIWLKPDGTKIYYVDDNNSKRIDEYNIGGLGFSTNETWVNGTNNNEHATLQQALTSQAFNRMNKAQLDAVADAYHFSQDSADTLDLMIAPYAASGTSPISDGVTINYDAEALVKQAINGTDYEAYFPSSNSVSITSLAAQNLKIRII